jgi:hypothetical protein
MDELDVGEAKLPLTLLTIHDIFEKYSRDINSITESEAEVVNQIEQLRRGIE